MKPVASFTGASVLQDPRTNDTYELLDFIGEGTFSVVQMARLVENKQSAGGGAG